MWCAFAALSTVPVPALAQVPMDAAMQVGALTAQVVTAVPTPWLLRAGAQLAISRGNADLDTLSGNLFYVRADEADKWRFAVSGNAARTTSGPVTLSQRYAADVAASRPLSPSVRLLLSADYYRAPLDGVEHRTALGGELVWGRSVPKKVDVHGLTGLYFATRHTLTSSRSYPEALAGVSLVYLESPTNMLSAVLTHMQDLTEGGNYRVGLLLSANAMLAGKLGVTASYSLSYDHQPVLLFEQRSQSFFAGVTLTFAPPPPAAPAKDVKEP